MQRLLARLVAGTLLFFLAAGAATAQAAPVTVKLRVEGPTTTLYEGLVTTDVRPFHFTGDAMTHVCDGTAAAGGTAPTPTVTRGAAMAAAIDAGLAVTGSWFEDFHSPSFSTIAGVNVAYDIATQQYLVEYDHGVYASIGGCADPVTNGEEVLFAYGDGNGVALSLTAPAVANVGTPVQFVVRDSANNVGQSGATVAGVTSNSDGVAEVTFPTPGTYTLKAEKPGAIRSNAVTVCVHNGNDGTCGFPLDAPPAPAEPTPTPEPAPAPTPPPVVAPNATDTTAPTAKIAALRSHFAKGKGPRELRGTVSDDGAIARVQVRLTRKSGKACSVYDAKRERFVRRACGKAAPWFTVGTDARWSYLLPSRLGKGLYQLQVRATDAAGHTSRTAGKRFRVA